MTVSFVSAGSLVTVANGNLTVSEGASLADGDLMLCPITYRDSVGFGMASGWALSGPPENTGNSSSNGSTDIASGLLAWKIRNGAESGAVFTRSGGDLGYGRIFAFRSDIGWPANPVDAFVSRTIPTNSATVVTSAGFTPSQNGELIVMTGHSPMSANPFASAEKANTNPSTGWTEAQDSGTTTGADGGLMLSYVVQSTAAATGTFQFTQSIARMSAIIVAAFKEKSGTTTTVAVDAAASVVSAGQGGKVAITITAGVAQAVSAGQAAKAALRVVAGAASTAASGKASKVAVKVSAAAAAAVARGKAALAKLAIAVGLGSLTTVGQNVTVTITGTVTGEASEENTRSVPRRRRSAAVDLRVRSLSVPIRRRDA